MTASLRHAPTFFRGATFTLLALRSGREGTLAVAERPDVGRAMFLDNHYMLGCSAGAPDMQRQAHLPLLLHPHPQHVCFVGFGTGITSAGALKHGAVESIDAIELCPLVADAAARYFNEWNQDLSSNPRAQVHVEDARTYLSSVKDRFDVIIGDLFIPWRPGEARLCSLEQFTCARAALRPGGVLCQWLPMTQLTREHFDTIVATFQRAFGQVHLFRNHLRTQGLPVALVGFKDTVLDWGVVARRCEFEKAKGLLRDPLSRHAEGLAMLYLGTYQPGEKFEHLLNTLDNLRIELDASRHLLAGDSAEYLAARSDLWLEFVDSQLARIEGDRELPPALGCFPRVAQTVSGKLTIRGDERPDISASRGELPACLPSSMVTDPDADWSLWPGL